MSLYPSTVPQFQKTLRLLEAWLDKAQAYAEAKPFDVQHLLSARLAPDQHPLLRQVQMACDTAKNTTARLRGLEPPKHPDTEATLAEFRARIATVLAYLEAATEAEFEGAESRVTPFPTAPGKGLLGADYVTQFALPNFYFHVTTAYAILRHNGVGLGKRDFIGWLPLVDL